MSGRISADRGPLTIPGVLDGDLVAALLAHTAVRDWFRSPMVRPDAQGRATLTTDRTAKARYDLRLEDAALVQAVGSALVTSLLPDVRRWFELVPTAHEAFKLVRYDAGDGWFTAHRDNVTPDAGHRQLALTINLDAGYEGGDLRFPEVGDSTHRPPPGGAIVFPCGLLHEVTPVVAGSRHALISFLW